MHDRFCVSSVFFQATQKVLDILSPEAFLLRTSRCIFKIILGCFALFGSVSLRGNCCTRAFDQQLFPELCTQQSAKNFDFNIFVRKKLWTCNVMLCTTLDTNCSVILTTIIKTIVTRLRLCREYIDTSISFIHCQCNLTADLYSYQTKKSFICIRTVLVFFAKYRIDFFLSNNVRQSEERKSGEDIFL